MYAYALNGRFLELLATSVSLNQAAESHIAVIHHFYSTHVAFRQSFKKIENLFFCLPSSAKSHQNALFQHNATTHVFAVFAPCVTIMLRYCACATHAHCFAQLINIVRVKF